METLKGEMAPPDGFTYERFVWWLRSGDVGPHDFGCGTTTCPLALFLRSLGYTAAWVGLLRAYPNGHVPGGMVMPMPRWATRVVRQVDTWFKVGGFGPKAVLQLLGEE